MLAKNISQFIPSHWIAEHKPFVDALVQGLCIDSREINDGDAFIALDGANVRGLDFADSASNNGAVAIIADAQHSNAMNASLPVVWIHELANKLAEIASAFYEDPSRKLRVIGVTGTNGKTSISWMLTDVFKRQGYKPAFIGTLGVGDTEHYVAAKNTTPDIVSLQKMLHELHGQGVTHVFMEVSSIGIEQGRIEGVRFDGAVFTQLSHDHLDYHKTLAEYERQKLRLFDEYKPAWIVTNLDDQTGKKILATASAGQLRSYSLNEKAADLYCEITEQDTATMFVDIYHQQRCLGNYRIELNAEYMLKNAAAVILCALELGIDVTDAIDKVRSVSTPPGRLQAVTVDFERAEKLPSVYVDYAHTPDALSHVLDDLSKTHNGRVITVVGCGGNRDQDKRALMGKIAAEQSSQAIFTSDNPRDEKPQDILQQMQADLDAATNVDVIEDRAVAIEAAINMAGSDDVVLIAGKGHENYQEVKGKRYAFSDVQVASSILAQLQGGNHEYS